MNIEEIYAKYQTCTGVSIDTRTIKPGDLFIGIKGPNFNGEQYANQAIASGAKYAVVSDPLVQGSQILHSTVEGESVLTQLAMRKRKSLSIPVIALTGSNGKTTTKELLYAVLCSTYKTYATEGNLNNHLGVPLTILRTPIDTEVLIIEMGANHQKEIAYLASIALPTVGLITNIGKAHLEGFGGEEGVYLGKKELFDYIAKNRHVAFVNKDDKKVEKAGFQVENRIFYSTSEIFTETGVEANNSIFYKTTDATKRTTQLTGVYNLSNIAAAIALGKYFDVHDDDIHRSICSYSPTNNRSQIIKRNNAVIIMDAYNANPDSMLASLKNLLAFKTVLSKKAILGEMLELGAASKSEHQKIIDFCIQSDITAILVGNSWTACDMHDFRWYRNVDVIDKGYIQNSCILLKGSRGVKLEKLLVQ